MTTSPAYAIFGDDTKEWYLNGIRHREDGPAIEYADGTKEWHQNGLLHREGKPAIILNSGTKIWYHEDKYHREDGPAIEHADGRVEWCLLDKRCSSEKEWKVCVDFLKFCRGEFE